jgi:hypothetical protein
MINNCHSKCSHMEDPTRTGFSERFSVVASKTEHECGLRYGRVLHGSTAGSSVSMTDRRRLLL